MARPPFAPEQQQQIKTLIEQAAQAAARQADSPEAPPRRWTLKRLVAWTQEQFGFRPCRETVRQVLRRMKLSWKKAKKLLGKADSARRQEFLDRLQPALEQADRGERQLVYLDEAHLHQDTDGGYGWCARQRRFWVASSSPGLSAKVTFYGLYLYDPRQVRVWAFPRANQDHTIQALERLREEIPTAPLTLIWDGAPWHRAHRVREAAARLKIDLLPLSAYSPDFMPVEALWRWLREDVTYHWCHDSPDELKQRVANFADQANANPKEIASRLALKKHLNPKEEKLRISI